METPKLKPIGTLLFEDTKKIKAEKENIKKGTERINGFVIVTQGVLGPLSKEQILELRQKGRKFIDEEVKRRYPFPNATDEFNLQAMGIDPKPAIAYWQTNANYWSGISFEIDEDGVFHPAEKQNLIDRHTYYIENEKQQKVLFLAEQFEQLFAAGDELGVLPSSEMARRTCKLLFGPFMMSVGRPAKIVPDLYEIATGREYK